MCHSIPKFQRLFHPLNIWETKDKELFLPPNLYSHCLYRHKTANGWHSLMVFRMTAPPWLPFVWFASPINTRKREVCRNGCIIPASCVWDRWPRRSKPQLTVGDRDGLEEQHRQRWRSSWVTSSCSRIAGSRMARCSM